MASLLWATYTALIFFFPGFAAAKHAALHVGAAGKPRLLGGNGVFALGHLHRADLLFFFPGFESVPSGLAFAVTAPGSYGFIGLFALSGALELGLWTESDDKEPGNFGDPVGFNQYTQEMRERELNNGRFAMFAAIGIIAAELYTGKDAVEQFGL